MRVLKEVYKFNKTGKFYEGQTYWLNEGDPRLIKSRKINELIIAD